MEKLRIQQAYYEALKQNDYDAIRELHAKFNSLMARSTKSSIIILTYSKRCNHENFNYQLSLATNVLATPNIVQLKKDANKEPSTKEKPYANEEPPVIGINKW